MRIGWIWDNCWDSIADKGLNIMYKEYTRNSENCLYQDFKDSGITRSRKKTRLIFCALQ